MTHPAVLGGVGLLGAAALFGLVWTIRRRQKLSPSGQLKETVARVSRKLKSADAALAATLRPALAKALAALDGKQVDPASKEGIRVREVLLRVEAKLDETVQTARAAKEQEAADELVSDMESALDAATEAMEAHRPR
jgi:ABC-type Fe3+-hydroxamate transport system substrate-binding protein